MASSSASVAPGRPVVQLLERQPRPLRLREPPPARERAERLHARGGCRPHRRLAPGRTRAHASRSHRRAACARHGPAPRRRGSARSWSPAGLEPPDGRRGSVRRGVRLRGDGTALELGSPPTGVFISNLNQAIGALCGARRRGIRVPDDVSLVSYDDDPLAEFLEVALTTIRMPLVELGIAAIGALADQIGGSARSTSRSRRFPSSSCARRPLLPPRAARR